MGDNNTAVFPPGNTPVFACRPVERSGPSKCRIAGSERTGCQPCAATTSPPPFTSGTLKSHASISEARRHRRLSRAKSTLKEEGNTQLLLCVPDLADRRHQPLREYRGHAAWRTPPARHPTPQLWPRAWVPTPPSRRSSLCSRVSGRGPLWDQQKQQQQPMPGLAAGYGPPGVCGMCSTCRPLSATPCGRPG